MEKGNFDEAMKQVAKRIEGCKERDPYAEAHYNQLASKILFTRYGQKIPQAAYDQAKHHLRRSLQIYESMEEDKRIRLMAGAIHLQIASLDLIVGRPEEGLQECDKALAISEKYKSEPLIKETSHVMSLLRLRKKTLEAEDTLTFAGTPMQSGSPIMHKSKIQPTRCPADGKKCPLPDGDHEARKKCPLYKCPLET